MSQKSRHELANRLRLRYLKASRSEKIIMLNEFVANTGMHRKAAIRLLRHPTNSKREKRGRPKLYTGSVVSALVTIWRVCGCICGKRLAPIVPDMVASLERHGELRLDAQTRNLLLQVSPATIDRLLKPFRLPQQRGRSTTKPGGLLKQQIAVRTFADWDDAQAGFVEIDLVAHCGDSIQGQFLCTLTATDVATGWTECMVLLHRSQQEVTLALDLLRQRLPFTLLGIDSDNDAVFINGLLLRYCETHHLTFTRCRPYKKNDQCFVEQKNWSIVRRTVGYGRYESVAAQTVLTAIYADLHLYVNLFQPTFKLKLKRRDGAKVYKQYDEPETPLARANQQQALSPRTSQNWSHLYRDVNPAALRRRIDENVKKLYQLREMRE